MSDYTKTTNFAAKDALSTGNPSKVVKGTEIDTEFVNIETAVATKTGDAEDNTLTGTNTLSGATTISGAATLSGDITLTGSIQGASPLILEGATADGFETTIAVTDPTADRTVTIPDSSGTIAYTSQVGRKNAVINGRMHFAQRGTTFTPADGGVYTYTLDRWAHIRDGGSATVTITQQSHTLGQTDVPYNPKYFLRSACSVAGSSATYQTLMTKIEDVATFSGETVVLSFYAKSSSTDTLPSILLTQNFGTGGTPSADVGTSCVSSLALTASWVKYEYSVAVPSVSGKTLGTDGNHSLRIDFGMPLNATHNVDISDVQLEVGSSSTAIEILPLATELANCKRYYEKSYEADVDPATATQAGVAAARKVGAGTKTLFHDANFSVEKRDTPTVSWYNPNDGTVDEVYNETGAAAITVTGATTEVPTSTKSVGGITHASTGATGSVFTGHWVADAEL